jgi:hypothetical protein
MRKKKPRYAMLHILIAFFSSTCIHVCLGWIKHLRGRPPALRRRHGQRLVHLSHKFRTRSEGPIEPYNYIDRLHCNITEPNQDNKLY